MVRLDTADPDRHVGRLNRSRDGAFELRLHRLEIDRVAQPQAERRDDRLGVVAGAVEATVNEPLDAKPQRIEERCDGERQAATATGDERERRSRYDETDEEAGEQAGQERVGQRPADQPVDVVEPVLRDPDAHPDQARRSRRSRRRRRPRRRGSCCRRTSASRPGPQGDPAAEREPLQLLALVTFRTTVRAHLLHGKGDA